MIEQHVGKGLARLFQVRRNHHSLSRSESVVFENGRERPSGYVGQSLVVV